MWDAHTIRHVRNKDNYKNDSEPPGKTKLEKNIFLGIVQVFQEKKRNSIRANPDDE